MILSSENMQQLPNPLYDMSSLLKHFAARGNEGDVTLPCSSCATSLMRMRSVDSQRKTKCDVVIVHQYRRLVSFFALR